MPTCGELIRSIRTQKQKTLAQLAEYCSISVPYASDIERGGRVPTDERLYQIAQFLKVDYAQLQRARDEDRGFIHIKLDDLSDDKRNLAKLFASYVYRLSKKDVQDIISILERKNGN